MILEQFAPTIAIIAALLLVWFGVRLCLRPDTRFKGVLMIVMAVVLVGNVAVWAL
jgi:energy-converting hydrogenase Eha subunit B